MTPERFAARLVLVDGMRPADAARATGLSPQGVCNAVARVRRADELVAHSLAPEWRNSRIQS